MKTEKEVLIAKFKELVGKMPALREQKAQVDFLISLTLARIDSIVGQLEQLGYKIPPSDLPIEFRPTFKGTVADKIEELIQEHNGKMNRQDLVKILVGIRRIEPKNARITVFNAIKRDKQNRFKTSSDGEVSLRK